MFFEGRPVWLQESPKTNRTRTTDERVQTARVEKTQIDFYDKNFVFVLFCLKSNPTNSTTLPRQTSPAAPLDKSTVDRTAKNGNAENFNSQMQNEHAWAIDRKRAGAK